MTRKRTDRVDDVDIYKKKLLLSLLGFLRRRFVLGDLLQESPRRTHKWGYRSSYSTLLGPTVHSYTNIPRRCARLPDFHIAGKIRKKQAKCVGKSSTTST